MKRSLILHKCGLFLSVLFVIFLSSPTNSWGGYSHSSDTADEILIADADDLTPATLSIFAWIEPTVLAEFVIANKYSASAGQRSWDFFIDGGDDLHFTQSNSASSFQGCTVVSTDVIGTDGELMHVGVTFDEGDVTLYKNGVAIANSSEAACTSTLANNTLPISLITNHNSDAHPAGKMYDLAIYSKVLSASEAASLHADDVKRNTLQISSSLVLLPFDDIPEGTSIDGITFNDLSGNGHNGIGQDADSDSLSIPETIQTY